eukprot:TRINITY_DN28867_c0_g1_i2.p1 TRINITY_DN28867_c0_g1~~TRINITY_DN28867_c0_g1_i2.p1  ORF type:complete len:567 (+),score=52.57 TRINITY_DN28867_c0_g1_i2:226-1701(+)
MGFMFVNVTGQAMLVGTGIGSVTLISQAFGAGNYTRCGESLQRQLAIHAFLVVAVAGVWLRCENILIGLGQPELISRGTAQFVLWRLAALPFIAIVRDYQCFLLAQRVMRFPIAVGVSANVLSIISFAVLIPRLGFVGAPLSITLANVLQAVCLMCLTKRFVSHQESLPIWSLKTALGGWKEIVMLGLPAGALQLGEWLAWECNLFFAGRLCLSASTCVELDVFPIVSNTMVIMFQIHNGFNLAAGALVGNALGAGDPTRARRIAIEVMVLVGTIAGVLAGGLYALRHVWGGMFVESDDVIRMTERVIPWVAIYVFIDSLGPGALVNILRNAGVVRVPTLVTFVAFYVIGIPCGLGLTFWSKASWGVEGLWIGLVIGLGTQVTGLMILFQCCLDWQRLADDAVARSRASASKLGSTSIGQNSKCLDVKAMYEKVEVEILSQVVDGHGGDSDAESLMTTYDAFSASPQEHELIQRESVLPDHKIIGKLHATC